MSEFESWYCNNREIQEEDEKVLADFAEQIRKVYYTNGGPIVNTKHYPAQLKAVAFKTAAGDYSDGFLYLTKEYTEYTNNTGVVRSMMIKLRNMCHEVYGSFIGQRKYEELVDFVRGCI